LLQLGLTSVAGLSGWRTINGVWRPSPVLAQGPSFEMLDPAKMGIAFVNDNARSEAHYLPESMASGCAVFDYDNDGWMDLFFVNTGKCDFFNPKNPPHNALYKNNRDGTFTDVTEKAGLLGGITFGQGVAVGDYDGDGYPDLYVTGYGHNLLYHNNGDGTFTDVTEKAGVAAPNWSTSAVWFDYDNDGRLDLFACSFVEYSVNNKVFCGDNKLHKRYYCIPRVFNGRASFLFHNNGDGTFTEVGHLTDIGKSLGKSHGVVATDLNNDGLMDLFVSNDTSPNFLFMNRGNGKFEEIGFTSGVAYSDEGQPRSGMGVDSADYDQDGRMDLYVANIDQERFALYHNDGNESFTDKAPETGIAQATRLLSGWGLRFFDYDNDGTLDIVQCDGHPDDMVDQYGTNVHYYEPMLLFHGNGKTFANVSDEGGSGFKKMLSARGLALGDLENNGCVGVVVSQNGGPPVILRNLAGRLNNWLGVRLIGTKSNIDAVGAWVHWSCDGTVRHRMKTGGGSYLSSSDPRLVLGLGQAKKLDWLEIKWPLPSGAVERFTDVPINTYITIVEGKGIQPKQPAGGR
jgi:hypothetical protein